HSISIHKSSLLQNSTTFLKVLLILIFIGFGLGEAPESSALQWNNSWKEEIILPAFAVSFVYVSFSYSGWNAAAYIAGEIRDARKNLPRALLLGTILVSLLYLLLNYVFLRQSPLEDLEGQLEIGQITANSIFGPQGGVWISFGIAILLVSSISAMTWAGPRVIQVLGEDHYLWRWFSIKTKNNIPLRAIWLQTSITLLLISTGTFEQVMIYTGFVLQLFATFTVAGVFVVRRHNKESKGFKSPLYPIPQLLFICLSLWILVYLVIAQPLETGFGLLNLVLGLAIYWWDRRLKKKAA
ncbi:MAG: APC family permease, partial [Bacteroidota bacterium]